VLRSRVAPHRLLASAGVYMECLGIRCVFCGSEPVSHPPGVSIQLAGLRYARSMERPVVCRACATDGHRTCSPLCPRSLSDPSAANPTEALTGGVLRCGRGGSTTSTALEKPAAVSVVGPPRGARCWRGRCRPATRWGAFSTPIGFVRIPPNAVACMHAAILQSIWAVGLGCVCWGRG
jgi:hypothetical protein